MKSMTVKSDQMEKALAAIKDATGVSLSTAEISEGSGISRTYISEFRNGNRNLGAPQQTALRAFLEKKCDEAGVDFPEEEPEEQAEIGDDQVRRLVAEVLKQQADTKPSIPLSEEIPEETRQAILEQVDKNKARIAQLMGSRLTKSGGLFVAGYSEQSDNELRELFFLLAVNYLAILVLTGDNILHAIEKSNPDFNPETVGELLSKLVHGSEFTDFAAHVPEKAEAAGEQDDE